MTEAAQSFQYSDGAAILRTEGTGVTMAVFLLILGLVLLCVFPPAGIALILLAVVWAIVFAPRPKVVVQQYAPPSAPQPPVLVRRVELEPWAAPPRTRSSHAPSHSRGGFGTLVFASGLASVFATGGFFAGVQYARNQPRVDRAVGRFLGQSDTPADVSVPRFPEPAARASLPTGGNRAPTMPSHGIGGQIGPGTAAAGTVTDRPEAARLMSLTQSVLAELDNLDEHCLTESDAEFREAVRRVQNVVQQIAADASLRAPPLHDELTVPMNAAVLSYVKAREARDEYDRYFRNTLELADDPAFGSTVVDNRVRLLEHSGKLRRIARGAAAEFRSAREHAAQQHRSMSDR